MPSTRIQARGIREFQRELRRVDKDLPKQLADAHQRVARFVVAKATARAGLLGLLEARAARSLSAARQQRVVSVRLGGARYPEALGAEFGAAQDELRNTTRGPVRGWNQFRAWRGNSTGAGYFLYPTIRAENDEIIERYGDEIEQLAARAFPDRG